MSAIQDFAPQGLQTQPRMFHQPVLPDQAEEGAYCFRTTDSSLHIYNGGAWQQVASGSTPASFASPFNPSTQIIFTPTGGIKLVVNGEEAVSYEPTP
jgi:hypothetical protein